MKDHRWTRIALISLAVAFGSWGLAGAADAMLPTGSPGVDIIAQNGFGDRNNSYAWSMDWFKGKLYVGTGRDELCLEDETLDFYYPLLNEYSANPSPDVRCTQNPYDLPLRAEIWQYTPSTDKWAMVYQAPQIANPLNHGAPVSRDVAYRGMTAMTAPDGKQWLFAAAVTPDEYIPELRTSHPPVLLRTSDGVHWQVMHMPAVWVHFPTGNFRPMGYRSLVVWRGHLYVTATPDLTGDGGLFEVTNPFSDHPGLVQVSDRELDIFEVATFDGGLYVGTGSSTTGYGVYRTFTDRGRPYNFVPVLTDGAGRGNNVTSVVSMHVFQNRLYVGASGWYNPNSLPVSEMIRVAPDGGWTLVVGNPRQLPDGRTIYPTSGLGDGFYDIFNAHFWRMADQGGALYVGTNNWDYLIQTNPKYAFLQSLFAGNLGFDEWATCDGNDWFAVTWDAFSGDEYNFGERNIIPDGQNGSTLYIGSANFSQGTTIFKSTDPVCSSLVNTSSAVARPAALMTDARERGTLLSWEPSAHASSYEVLRASVIEVTLNLQEPPALPSGFRFDDEMPILTQPGAPGSTAVTLPVALDFRPIATTDETDYVDPARGRYMYEVIAKDAAGYASDPSNFEVVPSEEPPASFATVRQALGSPTAGVASAGAAPGSNAWSLLDDAEGAWARGSHGAALADLAALQRAAGENDLLAEEAARLDRQLRYAGVGG